MEALVGFHFHAGWQYILFGVVELIVRFVAGLGLGSLFWGFTHAASPSAKAPITAGIWIARVSQGAAALLTIAAIALLVFRSNPTVVLIVFFMTFAVPFSLFTFGRGLLRVVEAVSSMSHSPSTPQIGALETALPGGHA